MVVHHPDRLHVRVADCRTDKLEASTLQVLAHFVRFLCSCRDLFQGLPPARFRSTTRETPDVRVEAPELLFHDQEGFGIFDGGRDLRSVPDDAGVGEERPDLPRIVLRDFHGIESVEGFSERLAFLEHREPGETRLCPFQDEEFEKLAVVMFRNTPLVVVIALARSRGLHAATIAFTQASSANGGSWKTALVRSFRTLFGPGARRKQGRRNGKYIRAVRPGSLGVSPAASRTTTFATRAGRSRSSMIARVPPIEW